MKTEKIYKFEKMYKARVKPSQLRMEIPTFPKWVDQYNDPFVFETTLKTEIVPAVEITIPMDAFEDMVDKLDHQSDTNREWHEFQKYNFTYGPGWTHRLHRLESNKKAEERLRQTNPALKKAWDHYQLLLKLCENQ